MLLEAGIKILSQLATKRSHISRRQNRYHLVAIHMIPDRHLYEIQTALGFG